MLPTHLPRWIVIPICIGLALVTILVGLALEPVAQAIAPQAPPTPPPTTPTYIHLTYAASQSHECIACHLDAERLRSMVETEEELRRALISAADMGSPHASLGCITCHRGVGGTEDTVLAHQGVVRDPSFSYFYECLICHSDLPDEIPEDRLRTPHSIVAHSVENDVACSDCHGAVGHGFDPLSGETLCSMSVCLECHTARQLDVQLEDCNACHIGPHDVGLTCGDCHVSVERWNATQLAVHPVELTGWHAQTDCFECHDWPDFGGLRYVCADCHNRPHDFGSDQCETCHTPNSWKE